MLHMQCRLLLHIWDTRTQLTIIYTLQGQENGSKQELIQVQPSPQDSSTAVPIASLLNL